MDSSGPQRLPWLSRLRLQGGHPLTTLLPAGPLLRLLGAHLLVR